MECFLGPKCELRPLAKLASFPHAGVAQLTWTHAAVDCQHEEAWISSLVHSVPNTWH